MIYIDNPRFEWKSKLWGHIVADSLDELHDFADKMNFKRSWFQKPPHTKYPHYDYCETKLERALSLGAILVDNRTLLAKAKLLAEEYSRGTNGSLF